MSGQRLHALWRKALEDPLSLPLRVWGHYRRALREVYRNTLDHPLRFPLTLRHYYFFDQVFEVPSEGAPALASSEIWDKLRIQHRHFYQADERETWLRSFSEPKDGQESSLKVRATEIAKLLRSRKITNVHSVGVGCAGLEYHLKHEMPSLHLTASEFAPVNVERLRKVFHECDQIVLFDIGTADWASLQSHDSTNRLVLMNRVDPCFANSQWKAVFKRMADSGLRQILFIPDTVLTLRYIGMLRSRRREAKLTARPLTFTGFVRTDRVFRSLWCGAYRCEPIVVDNARAYWLTAPKSRLTA